MLQYGTVTEKASGNTLALFSGLGFQGNYTLNAVNAADWGYINGGYRLPLGDILALFANGVIEPIDDRIVR